MPRTLRVARATVGRGDHAAYLAALGELAARLRARGESLWLFRHPVHADTFLEFSESASRDGQRSRAARSQDEQALEQRVRSLATYASDAGVLWEEVPLEVG